jgi:hypothetical protein
MQLLLHTTNTSLLWQQRSAQHSPAAVSAFVQSRTNLMRVLEALLDSGAAEQLVRPEQIMQDGGGLATDLAAGGNLGFPGGEIPADLAEQVSAGIPTLQDLAARLLLDHVFLAGSLTSLAGNAAAAGGEDGAGSSEAAAALAAAASKLLPSMTLLNKWVVDVIVFLTLVLFDNWANMLVFTCTAQCNNSAGDAQDVPSPC